MWPDNSTIKDALPTRLSVMFLFILNTSGSNQSKNISRGFFRYLILDL